MKQIMQFRYEAFNSENNYPQYTDYYQKLCKGNIFSDYPFVSQLGIQGPPGMRFYLNRGNDPITIGKTGIYELDLENIGRIFAIRFNKDDLDNLILDTDSRLLVDIIYNGG